MAAYNNPSRWGAFAGGIAGGVNAGTQNYLAGRQLLGQEQQRAETIKMQQQQIDMQRDIHALDYFYKVMSNENFPDSMKIEAANNSIDPSKRLGIIPQNQNPQLTEWDSSYGKTAKSMLGIYNDAQEGKITWQDALKAAQGKYFEVTTPKSQKFIEGMVKDMTKIQSENAQKQLSTLLSPQGMAIGYADKERTQPIAGMTDQEIKQEVGALSQYLPKDSVAYDQAKNLLVPKEEKATGVGTTNDGWTVFFDPSKKAQMATKLGSPPVYYDTNAHGVLPSSEKTKVTVAIQGAEARGESFAKNRWYDVYDKEKGQIVKKQGKDLNANPDQYVSPSEPLVGSLKNQEKVYGMMGGFVTNLNKQIGAIDGIMAELNRTGIRAVDMPLREIRMRLKGSGQEKVLESYLAEISREIGKLSTGSAASIAELSVDAQKKWDKIHDPNLPMGELKLILNATKEQANMRLSSSQEQIKATHERLGFTPSQTPPPETPKSLTSGSLPNEAVSKLKEDVITTFGNGQQWMLKNGKPVRLK